VAQKLYRDPKTGAMRREKHGVLFPASWTALDIDLWCFRTKRTIDQGGLGQEEHWWRAVDYFFGPNNPVHNNTKYFIRNPLSEEMIYHACRERYIAIGSGSGFTKSETAGLWLFIQYLADARNFLGLFVSTSLKESKRRGWGSLCSFINAVPHNMLPLRVLESGIIKYESPTFKATDQASISLIAWEKKQDKEAVSKAQGMHQNKVCLVIDEATELPPSVLEYALPGGNLSANPWYQVWALANPLTYFDTFAQLWKPEKGWTSISAESDIWRTQYGVGLHFDGMRSPNIPVIKYITPMGLPFLPTQAKLDEVAATEGGLNTVRFWRMFRGFPCPTGTEDLIYSPIDIVKYKGDEPAIWGDQPLIRVAALDPSFTNGGDRTILYFGTLGRDKNGMLVLQFDDYVQLFEDVTNKTENRSEQIARQLRDQCVARGILPQHVAIDATGAGAPFCDVVDMLWSREILRVNFGGDASEFAVSMTDLKPAKERYKNRVSEIWYRGKDLLRQGQLKGICPAMAAEMSIRHYSIVGTDSLIEAESKADMKLRTAGQSPDISDAGFIMVTLCVERLGLSASLTPSQRKAGRPTTWAQKRQRMVARLTGPVNLGARRGNQWQNPEA
jgi:hypothetical protein